MSAVPLKSHSSSSSSSTKRAGPYSSSSSSYPSPSSTKRLLSELNSVKKDISRNPTIERLGPVDDDDLYHWQAVINGRALGGGYASGRWLLDVRVPDGRGSMGHRARRNEEDGVGGARSGRDGKHERSEAYPFAPPVCTFVTKICAANVAFETGEICLDLLKSAWTPAYTLSSTVDAICQMLAAPEVDSPMNVDVAAILRSGDKIGAESVVRRCCAEWRYDER